MNTTEVQTVGAEAPIAVAVASHGIYPLTPCCQATGKGSIAAGGQPEVVCRACYTAVDDIFGMAWQPDDEQGWGWYTHLLAVELMYRRDFDTYNAASNKAEGICRHVREKIAAL